MAPTPRTYSPRGTYFCTYDGCSATFPRQDRLEHHERTHTGERPFICVLDDCKKSYTRREHLKRHIAVFHKAESKDKNSFQCDRCSLLFKNADCLKKHINRFHTDTTLTCDTCQKRFLKHRKLKEHLFVHTGIKPFKCTHDGCSKDFVVWTNFKRHQKTHEGYACNDKSGCREVLATWSLLRKHKAEKHSPVPTCDKCGRKFSCRSRLKVHLPSHDDFRKSFHCTYDDCPRYYFFVRNLQHHIRSYHLEKNHPCPFENCGQNFVNQTKLRNHLRLHDAKSSPPRNKKKNRRKAEKRKERKKALPRKAMACVLSGFEVSKEEDMKLIKGLDVDCNFIKPKGVIPVTDFTGTLSIADKDSTDASPPENFTNVHASMDKCGKDQVNVPITQEMTKAGVNPSESCPLSQSLNLAMHQEHNDCHKYIPSGSQKSVTLENIQRPIDMDGVLLPNGSMDRQAENLLEKAIIIESM